jgi:hypothetical protein
MHTSLTSKFIEIQGVEQTFRTARDYSPRCRALT